jgi:hypothetical protein
MLKLACLCAVTVLAASLTVIAAAPGGGGGTEAGAGGGAARGGGRGRGGGGEFGAFGPAARGPAPTLTAPATPMTKPDEDGFIRRWMVLEPIPAIGITQNDYRTTVSKEYFPNQFTVIPKDGQKVTVDGAELTWHACESSHYNVNLFHFTYALNKTTAGVFWWVVTVVNAPEEMKDVRLAIGSNDASVWWLNGTEVIGIYGNRMDTIDDGVSKKLTLKKGPNVIRAAVANQMGPTDFCARFLDANDKPITNLSISLSGDGR